MRIVHQKWVLLRFRGCLAQFVVWVAGTLLFLGASGAVATEYLESYAKGVESYESQQWADAVQWLRQAIEERPKAGGQVAVAGESQPYVPYHQLALALYFGDALEEAEQMWVKSEENGVVAKELPQELPQIETYRADIAERLEALQAIRTAVGKQLQRADRQIIELDEPRLQLVLARDTELARGRQAAIEKLERARRLHGEPQSSENLLSEAHALAIQSASALETIVLKATRQAIEEEGS